MDWSIGEQDESSDDGITNGVEINFKAHIDILSRNYLLQKIYGYSLSTFSW